jgi:thymidine kinase
MSYGFLEVFTGPMFGGKTAMILERYYQIKDEKIFIKPAFDTRFGETKVASRNGMSAEAIPLKSWLKIPSNIKHVFVDEINFMCEPMYNGNFIDDIRGILKQGINVYASGLDTDWQGRGFDISAQMIAMADTVHKLHARCNICGKPAGKTFKKVISNNIFEQGDKDLYEARCNEHWHCHDIK